MDKRYIAVAAVLVVAAFAVFSYRGLKETQSGIEHPYNVYNGEEFLHDAYPYIFVFFGDNRSAEGKEQPKTFKNIIQKINNDNPLFVIAFVASMYCDEAVAFRIVALSVTTLLLNGKGPRYYSVIQNGEKYGQ